MRIPSQISLCGHTVKVKFKKSIIVNGQECWGCYDDSTSTIYLKMKMDRTRKMEIFLHEAIHAIEHIHVLQLSEKSVKILGLEILALIRNNKINFLERKPRK